MDKAFKARSAKRIVPAIMFQDDAHGLYSQHFFRASLIRERKRTERSGRPFLLILFDVRNAPEQQGCMPPMEAISSLFRTCMRDTDICGWYVQDEVAGFICTEIDSKSMDTVLEKILTNLYAIVPEEYSIHINVTWYLFPLENADQAIKLARHDGLDLYEAPTGEGNRKLSLFCKRAIDIAASIFGILVSLPVFCAIALLIKLDSKGPVFFCQQRIGKGGRPFKLYKFRSMHAKSDSAIHREVVKKFIAGAAIGKNGVYEMEKDPRITRSGRFLRKSSLDELPQLFNVLTGDMSLVGPRPSLAYEIENYDIWHKRRVFEAKPGITGLWQVFGRSTTSFENMVRMDINYIKNRSFWLDIKLLLRTPYAVLMAKGAY